jgi:phosphoglycerate dehydrogenase-like enzyme
MIGESRSESSNRPVVVIPGDEPEQIGTSPHLDRLRARAEVILHRDRPPDLDELVRRAVGATAVINSQGGIRWSAAAFERLPGLRFLTVVAIGTDNVDIDAARRCGVVVANVPGRTAPIVAEHALALMLAAGRRLVEHTAAIRSGRWDARLCTFFAGKTLGVVGTGPTGQAMIRLGRGIGMDILGWTLHPDEGRAKQLGIAYVELDDLLMRSDTVSVHARLTSATWHLLDARRLSLMKPGAILVNTARGAIIETEALVEALRGGPLAAAGLDVYEDEPLTAGHPLTELPNLVLTPHSADQTVEGRDRLNGGAVDNVLAFLDGRPRNLINGSE